MIKKLVNTTETSKIHKQIILESKIALENPKKPKDYPSRTVPRKIILCLMFL